MSGSDFREFVKAASGIYIGPVYDLSGNKNIGHTRQASVIWSKLCVFRYGAATALEVARRFRYFELRRATGIIRLLGCCKRARFSGHTVQQWKDWPTISTRRAKITCFYGWDSQ
jgi:hypothetical protein